MVYKDAVIVQADRKIDGACDCAGLWYLLMQMKGNKLQDYSGFSTVITFAVSERSHLRLSFYNATAYQIIFPGTVSRHWNFF